jgi:tetratricopeptide (TPR) repeat protein
LSLHFLHARRYADAWRYSRLAADQARDIHAQAEAAELYERALEVAGRVESGIGDDVAAVAEALGDARYKLGEFGRAALAYRSARLTTKGDVEQARLCYKCSLVAERVGQFPNALRWLTKARTLLATASGAEADRLRAECGAEHGLIRHWQGRDVEAVVALTEAVAATERAGAQDALATALVWLDNCEMTLGGSGDGEHARRALEILRTLGKRPWQEARVLNQLGIRAYFGGQWDLAVDFYRQSKEACDRAGDQFTAAVESGNMAEVLADQGRLAEAEPLMREAQRVWRAAGAPSFVAFGKSQLGRLAARSGRFDDALELLTSARDDYVRDGEHAEVLETDARLAECLLLQGNSLAALQAADAGLVRAPSGPGVLPQVPLLQRVRGVALSQLGRFDDACEALDASLTAAEERRAQHEVAWTIAARLAVERAAGRSGQAAMSRRQAELFRQLGIVTVADVATPT